VKDSSTMDLFETVAFKGYEDIPVNRDFITKDSTIKEALAYIGPMVAVVDREDNNRVLGSVRISDLYRTSIKECSCMSSILPFLRKVYTHRVTEDFDSLISRYLKSEGSFHEDDIIALVYHDHSFYGSINVRDILKRIEKRRFQEALYTNPLTGLPGRPIIEKQIKTRRGEDICLTDLSDFKAYNDKYGVGRGDEVLRYTARILSEEVGSNGFVGHIGGDDFFFMSPKSIEISRNIVSRFDQEIRDFYDPEDAEDGYIASRDRHGELARFPIMTISISIAQSASGDLADYTMITHSLASLKKKAKAEARKEGRSIFLVDKRNLHICEASNV